MSYQDFSNLSVKWTDPSITIKMVLENHYTHSVACGVLVSLGVYDSEKLSGCILYSLPKYPQMFKSISPLITRQQDVLELTRLWISDKLGPNVESWTIGKSFRFIEDNFPQVKVLVSFSDKGQNHLGIIYQSTNWYYLGLTNGQGSQVYIINGKRLTSRGIFHRFGQGYNTDELGKIYPNLQIVEGTQKHRYILPIGSKLWKRKLMSSLYTKPQPYPKNNQIVVTE
jgi:hypothetical protein